MKEPQSSPVVAIVDDDVSVRESLQRLIRSVGLGARVFASAEAFLNSNLLDETTCLILDVVMPEMNGLELQRRLVESKIRIPIIFITAHAAPGTKEKALGAGAVGFLNKPFKDTELLAAVTAAVTQSD
jgi:FixJ family two-component response regulator